jgi:hypothetical protein
MILPSEVRVGNYLIGKNDRYCDRSNRIAKNVFEVSIVSDNIICLDIGFDARQRYEKNPIWSPSYSDLFGIELTAKWLLRFGFVKFSSVVYKCDELNLSYNVNSKTYTMPIQKTSGKIECVHQLQNLYWSLTGKELVLQDS